MCLFTPFLAVYNLTIIITILKYLKFQSHFPYLIPPSHAHQQKQQLLRLSVPSLFIAVALDEGPGPPMRSPYTDLTKLYAVVGILVRCCNISVMQKSCFEVRGEGRGGKATKFSQE